MFDPGQVDRFSAPKLQKKKVQSRLKEYAPYTQTHKSACPSDAFKSGLAEGCRHDADTGFAGQEPEAADGQADL